MSNARPACLPASLHLTTLPAACCACHRRLLVEQSRLQGGSRRQGSRRALVQAVRNSFKRLGERGATCVRSREGQQGEEAGGHEGEVQLDVGDSHTSGLVDTLERERQGSPHAE